MKTTRLLQAAVALASLTSFLLQPAYAQKPSGASAPASRTATAPSMRAASAPSMRKTPVVEEANLLAPGINAPKYVPKYPPDATWPIALIGVWYSSGDPVQGIAPGTLSLAKDNGLKMEPEGMFTLQGYWYVSAGRVVFDTPLNVVKSEFKSLSKDRLLLKYENGMSQTFERKQ